MITRIRVNMKYMRVKFFYIVMILQAHILYSLHLDPEVEQLLRNEIQSVVKVGQALEDKEHNRCFECMQQIEQHLDSIALGNLTKSGCMRLIREKAQDLFNEVLSDTECKQALRDSHEKNTDESWKNFRSLCAKRGAYVLRETTSLRFPSLEGRSYANVAEDVRRKEFLIANKDLQEKDFQAYEGGILFLFYLHQLQKDNQK